MTVDDFEQGDRVRHVHRGRTRLGTVEKIADGAVHVAFDDTRGRGIYDAGWFRMIDALSKEE
jgi:hypothetical protein